MKNKKVEAVEVRNSRKVSDLINLMGQTGFQGKSLAATVDVFEKMIKDKKTTILFGYAGEQFFVIGNMRTLDI